MKSKYIGLTEIEIINLENEYKELISNGTLYDNLDRSGEIIQILIDDDILKKLIDFGENNKLNKFMRGTVQVVVINPEGYILGVSRKEDHTDFGLVGGSLEDYDATPEEGAIRETFEETGLKISNLRLIYAKSKGGRMGYTYLADYEGEIDYDVEKEPHVVKWTVFDEVLKGTFGDWNKQVFQSLQDLKIFVRLTDSECGTCYNCKCDNK